MSDFQLSILQQDSQELTAYISEVKQRGKTELASKLSRKLEFLNSRIADFT